MKKDQVLSVKSTLARHEKQYVRSHRTTMNDENFEIMKKATVILPIVIIGLIIIILIAGIHQYKAMFRNIPEKTDTETSTHKVLSAVDEEKLLIIISADSPVPSDYRTNLRKYEGYDFDEIVIDNLKKLMNDSDKDGLSLKVSGGFVSAEQQHEKYMDEVRRLIARGDYSETKAMEDAEKLVPMENHSEMQSGLAVKFSSMKSSNFSQSAEYLWLRKNAFKYGFILRYPPGKENSTGFAFDATHFRYVGTENALRIHSQNMSLEEYVTYLNSRP